MCVPASRSEFPQIQKFDHNFSGHMQSPQQGSVDVPQASNSGFVCDLLARTLGLWIGWVSSQGFVSAEAVVTVVENALENLKVVRKLLPFHAEVVLGQQLGA